MLAEVPDGMAHHSPHGEGCPTTPDLVLGRVEATTCVKRRKEQEQAVSCKVESIELRNDALGWPTVFDEPEGKIGGTV